MATPQDSGFASLFGNPHADSGFASLLGTRRSGAPSPQLRQLAATLTHSPTGNVELDADGLALCLVALEAADRLDPLERLLDALNFRTLTDALAALSAPTRCELTVDSNTATILANALSLVAAHTRPPGCRPITDRMTARRAPLTGQFRILAKELTSR